MELTIGLRLACLVALLKYLPVQHQYSRKKHTFIRDICSQNKLSVILHIYDPSIIYIHDVSELMVRNVMDDNTCLIKQIFLKETMVTICLIYLKYEVHNCKHSVFFIGSQIKVFGSRNFSC